MTRPFKVLVAFAFLAVTACSAGEPQDEALQAEARLHLWPLGTTSAEARQYFADGIREMDMQHSPEAYQQFQRAIAADPDLAVAHLYAAGASQSEEAFRAHLADAVERSADAGEVERTLVQHYEAGLNGDAETALEEARRLTSIDGENPRTWLLLADAHNALAQRAEARVAAERAAEIDPDFSPAQLWLAWSYVTHEPRDLARSEEHARRAVELDPAEAAPYDLLGDAVRARGRLEEAAQAYSTGAEIDPTNGLMLQQRAHVNTFLGRYAEARADYDAATGLASGNAKATFPVYRAFVHVHEGNPVAALEELERHYHAIDGMDPPNPDGAKSFVVFQQASIAYHHGLIDQHRQAVERQVALERKRIAEFDVEEVQRTAAAFIALSQGFHANLTGDYALAEAKAAEYLRLREPDRTGDKEWPAYNLRGMIAFKQGRFEDAVSHFARSNPDNEYLTFHTAAALEALGRTDEALAAYRQVADYYFNSVSLALVRKTALEKVEQLGT